MEIGKTGWALALALSVAVLATSAQAAVGKSTLGKSLRPAQTAKTDVGLNAKGGDQGDDASRLNHWPSGLKHKFGIRR